MIEKPAFTDLLKQAANLLPDSAANLRADFEQNLRPLVEASFAKLDLVTREEFDQQLTLFERLQERTLALEAELKTLTEAQENGSQENTSRD